MQQINLSEIRRRDLLTRVQNLMRGAWGPRALHDYFVYLPVGCSTVILPCKPPCTPGTRLSKLPNTSTISQMGQSPSTQPSKSGTGVVDLPKLDFRATDPPVHPPSGLALIAHGRSASIDCPVVAALATCLREKHGCRTVTWSARGVGNSEGTTGSHAENRKDYNVSLSAGVSVLYNTTRS